MSNAPFTSHFPDETIAFARRFAAGLQPGAVLALYGDLGSGKTCFVRGLAQAFNITTPITSPTFTLINEYPSTPALYHMDLYRIDDLDSLYLLGLDDYFEAGGVTVIEWAERAEQLLPARTIRLHFYIQNEPESRVITIKEPE